jgi:hypothetical protein
LDGQLNLVTNGEIGASLPFGASSSIDETHTTTIALSAAVPLISASGASYAGTSPIPEPSTLWLLGGAVLMMCMGPVIRRRW